MTRKDRDTIRLALTEAIESSQSWIDSVLPPHEEDWTAADRRFDRIARRRMDGYAELRRRLGGKSSRKTLWRLADKLR